MKKKILFVNGHLNVGGVEKSLVDLLQALDYSKYEVDLLLLESKGVYADNIPSAVRVILYETPKVYGSLIPIICKHLVHFHFSFIFYRLILVLAPFLGKWMYKLLRPLLGIQDSYDYAIAYRVGMPNDIVSLSVNSKRKICWWHNGECNYNSNGIKHINSMWENIDCVVAVSNGCKSMIREKFKFNKDIVVIPNIIDVDTIITLAGNQNPYKDEAYLRIVTLGRLCWEKHIEDVPHIAKKLIDGGYNRFRWYIIGDGAKKDIIAANIKELGLKEHVIMLGRKSNPYPYLKNADIMMHTSYVEAHCLTLLEAMSLHTPCVATKTILPQDFTLDSVNCILVDQDINSQYEGLKRMIQLYPNTSQMTDAAFEMVKHDYCKEVISEKFDNLLSQLK